MTSMIGQFVVVRCRDAGVHCGVLERQEGREATLTDARRIWRWRGANTLNEVATAGISQDYSRVSVPVERIALSETCEVLQASAAARENLSQSRWGA